MPIKPEEIKNAAQHPMVFYARHMGAGLAGYESETILVDTEAMQRMSSTFAAKPLYVQHQDVDLATIQEDADGWVVRSFYNELDGCLWAECLAISDEAHRAIKNGWAVSNAYEPKEWAPGGRFHNVDYDRKIVNAEFTHLALVPDPRYEEAKVYTPEEFKTYQDRKREQLEELRNSKTGEKKMFKMFKNTRQEVTAIDEDTQIELEGGKTVSIAEMIKTVQNSKKNEDEDKKEKMNMDTEVEVGEEKMPLKELVNKYMAMCNKKNADVDGEEAEATEKEAEEEAKKEKKNKEKKNSSASEIANAKAKAEKTKIDDANFHEFMELRNASARGAADLPPVIETSLDREKRGKEKY